MGINVKNSTENFKECSCPNFPTYKNSPLKNALFCARGKSDQEVLESGCLCVFCPVADKYGLKLEYYCSRGKSNEIPEE